MVNDSKELKELIMQRPELPLIVLCNSEVVADDSYCWWYANDVRCNVGIYLDKEPEWTDKFYTDEDEFNEDLEEYIWDTYKADGVSDEQLECLVNEKIKEYEPHWKEAIEVWCDV